MDYKLNYVSSILLGVFMKIYDDFVDLKIKKYPVILDISKIMIVGSTYFLIDECYILSLIVFVSLVISNYCKKFDDTFWYAYMGFVGALSVFNYKKLETLIQYVEPFKLMVLIFIPAFIYFEETTFTEEKSKNKMMARFYGIIINSIIVFVLEFFDWVKEYNLGFFVYLIIFVNSYFLTNIIIQLWHSKYYKSESESESAEKN